jgi:hypothetical protein
MSTSLVSTRRAFSLAVALLAGASTSLSAAAYERCARATVGTTSTTQNESGQNEAGAPADTKDIEWREILPMAGAGRGMNGSIAVVCWEKKDGALVKAGGIIPDRFTTEFTAALQRAGGRIVEGDRLAKGMADASAAARKLGGEAAQKSLDATLSDRVQADLIIEILFTKEADYTLRPTLRLLDCRGLEVVDLFRTGYRSLPADGLSGQPGEPEAVRIALTTKLVRDMIAKFMTEASEPALDAVKRQPPYYLLFHGIGDETRRDALLKALEDLAKEPNSPIKNIEPSDIKLAEGGGLWVVEVQFEGRSTRDLTKLINRALQAESFKEDTQSNLAVQTANESGKRIVLYQVIAAGLPRWERFAPTMEGETRTQEVWDAQCRPDRTRTLTVLTVTDGNAKGIFAGINTGVGEAAAFGDTKLADALGEMFTNSGFEYVPVAQVRAALETDTANASRLDNHAGLIEALEQRPPVDYCVLVSKDPATGELAVQMLELRNRARQLGLARWPDQAHAIYGGKVKPDDAESVARYLTGSLLADASSWCQRQEPSSIEVIVKNSLEPATLLAFIDRFKQMAGVGTISDVAVQQPVGSFRINVTKRGSVDDVLSGLFAGLNDFGWPVTVESADQSRIILNLDFKLAAPEKLDPSKVKETVDTAKANAGSPLLTAMEKARASVWVVGFELSDGRFFPGGTAWTVRDKVLATNAHVVEGIRRERAEVAAKRPELLHHMQLVGRSGDGSERRIVLSFDDTRSHPLYAEASKIFGAAGTISPCDVGLISVTSGDPGKPLPLASAADIKALKPLSPIGYIGFPMEGRSTFRQRPTQVSVLGALNAVTTEFMQPSEDGTPELLHYDVTNGGGASGSPVFGPNGTVIGINSAGDVVGGIPVASIALDANGNIKKDQNGEPVLEFTSLRRVPLGFSYAQGLVYLQDMLDGGPQPTQGKAIVTTWTETVKQYMR